MARKQTIQDLDVSGKRVFVRVDFNVPLDAAGEITDDSRIRASLPTIRYLLDHGAAVILASHLGRPGGRAVPTLSLAPVAKRLSRLLEMQVTLAPDSVGTEVSALASSLKPGQVLLLENLRFHPEEEANNEDFARALAGPADIYVDDAFGSAHRSHASTTKITEYLPAVAGFLMSGELDALGSLLANPERPLAAVIGGAKISSKIGGLRNLLAVADEFLIGGGMANTLLKSQGVDVAASLVEDGSLGEAGRFLKDARNAGKKVYLPVDVLVADRVEQGARTRVVRVEDVPAGWAIVDIGPDTVKTFGEVLRRAATVVWNGPMGIFEIKEFAVGTRRIASMLSEARANTIVGGGDSVAAIEQLGLAHHFFHVSTGGGAALEYLEGRELPGVEALAEANKEVA